MNDFHLFDLETALQIASAFSFSGLQALLFCIYPVRK
jgi:hypothetical protein